MFYIAYAILMICLFMGFALMKREKAFSPVVITASIWFVVFAAGSFFYQDFYPLIEKNVVLWLCWFLISCSCYLLFSPGSSTGRLGPLRSLPMDYSVLILLLIIALIYKIWEVGTSGPSHFLLNLRLSTMNELEDSPSLGLVGRFYPLIFALFIFESINASAVNRRLRFLLWGWMLLFAVATMGKFAILTPVVAWLVIKQRKGEIKSGKLTLIGATLLGLMLVMHVVRAGEGDEVGLMEILALYIYSPIIALGELEMGGSGTAFAEYTFRFFYALKHSLFGGAPPVKTILEYVMVPTLTNVYTVMQPFYIDFGVIGVFLGALFYGVFFGVLYRFYMRGGQLAVVMYAGLAISLISQFIGETAITNFSGNLQFAIAAAIVVFLSKEGKCVSRHSDGNL